MPALTADLKLAADNTAQLFTLPLDYHILKAASVQNLTTAALNNDAWVQIAILSGGDAKENTVAFLKSGYSGLYTPVYWTGSIPVEADQYLAATITGHFHDSFRLSCILWKIRLDEKGEFRADP